MTMTRLVMARLFETQGSIGQGGLNLVDGGRNLGEFPRRHRNRPWAIGELPELLHLPGQPHMTPPAGHGQARRGVAMSVPGLFVETRPGQPAGRLPEVATPYHVAVTLAHKGQFASGRHGSFRQKRYARLRAVA